MLKNYLKTALKVLMRRKFFTLISLFAVSFTLVVLMLVTALIDHVVRPGGPERRSPRFLVVEKLRLESPDRNSISTSDVGYMFLDRFVRPMETPELISVYSNPAPTPSYLETGKITSHVRRTDGVYWQVFDFEFVEGGPFSEEDDASANFVAVISEKSRRQFFGERTGVVGEWIDLDGQRYRVAGVVENVSVLQINAYADAWVPISTNRSSGYRDQMLGEFHAVLLGSSPGDRARMKDEFRGVLDNVEFPDPKRFNLAIAGADTKLEFMARGMFNEDDKFDSSVGKLMALILGLMALFMLLPAINLININVSRIIERSSEIGIRKAFGASSRTLVGQFIVENVILTAIGGVLGLIGAYVVLWTIQTSELIPYAEFGLNLRIFGYALAMIVFFGVFSGVYPAWKMSRLHPVEALRGRG